jgi:hypothetical protein
VEPEDKKALERYILASDKRVELWSEADRKAFKQATEGLQRPAQLPQSGTVEKKEAA